MATSQNLREAYTRGVFAGGRILFQDVNKFKCCLTEQKLCCGMDYCENMSVVFKTSAIPEVTRS